MKLHHKVSHEFENLETSYKLKSLYPIYFREISISVNLKRKFLCMISICTTESRKYFYSFQNVLLYRSNIPRVFSLLKSDLSTYSPFLTIIHITSQIPIKNKCEINHKLQKWKMSQALAALNLMLKLWKILDGEYRCLDQTVLSTEIRRDALNYTLLNEFLSFCIIFICFKNCMKLCETCETL